MALYGTAKYGIDKYGVTVLGTIGRRGIAKVIPRLFLSDKLNNLKAEISSDMLGGSIEMRLNRRVKMIFNGQLKNPDIITPFTDYLAPFQEIKYSDGTSVMKQLGLYSVIPFGEESTYYNSFGQFSVLDISRNLTENTFGNYLSVAIGQNVVDTVINGLIAEGFTRYSIPASTKTFPRGRTYDIARNKWNIWNSMLSSINYYHMWVDSTGVITSLPYIDYDQAEPAKVLTTGPGSDVVNTIKREPLDDRIFNKVRVIGERPRTNNPIIVTLINSNPASPTSTIALGRTRQHPTIQDSDIEDTTTATELARRVLQESSSLYNRYTLETLPDPSRGFFEVYETDINHKNGDPVMNGRFRVSGWDLTLDHKTPMRHYLNRLEPYQ